MTLVATSDNEQPLTEQEIDQFIDSLYQDDDGCFSYAEVEQSPDAAYEEPAPDADLDHLHRPSRKDEDRHEFLRQLIGKEKGRIPAADFRIIVQSWQIPSLEQDKYTAHDEGDFLKAGPAGSTASSLLGSPWANLLASLCCCWVADRP